MEYLLWFFAITGAALGAFSLCLIWGLVEVIKLILDSDEQSKERFRK